ncbi:MAG TPA: STAS/SEC14 domain-containing protein [Myxococcaceae bacterium]|nr:STAS/SEC14 domain-containing protein [Myxococcaceae bacterium]
MTARREWTFGNNRVDFEPPDLVVARFNGAMNLEEAERTIEIYRELGTRGPFFLISDVSDASMDKEAREYLTQNVRTEWLLGVVYVGAGLVQKAATKAMTFAVYLTGGANMDFLFASTEEEARALYERKRQEWSERVA